MKLAGMVNVLCLLYSVNAIQTTLERKLSDVIKFSILETKRFEGKAQRKRYKKFLPIAEFPWSLSSVT